MGGESYKVLIETKSGVITSVKTNDPYLQLAIIDYDEEPNEVRMEFEDGTCAKKFANEDHRELLGFGGEQ